MDTVPGINGVRPRSCWLEIDLDRLGANLDLIRDRMDPGTDLLAVVKAEAYGHGAEVVSEFLCERGVEFLGVATLEEALKLRHFGIEGRILVMGHLATYNVDVLVEYDLVPMVFSFRLLHALNEEGRRRGRVLPFHLKVDTGMGRLGLLPGDLDDFLDEVADCEHVRLDGLASHLAVAGENETYTGRQHDEFRRVRDRLERRGMTPSHTHVMNSAALFSSPHASGNMVRPGITLYGYSPHGESLPGLKPVLEAKTKMADYKRLPAGKGVSYGRVFTPEEPTWVGVLPIGYADGYRRAFTGRAHVLKNGRRCRVLGRVCMDMTMVELTAGDDPEQTVVLLGEDGSEALWADTLADWARTIPYEILSGFSQRLPRIYLRNNRPVALKNEHGVDRLPSTSREDLGLGSP